VTLHWVLELEAWLMKLKELMASPRNPQQCQATPQAVPMTIFVALQALIMIMPELHLQAAVISLSQENLVPRSMIELNLKRRHTITLVGMPLLVLVLVVLAMKLRNCTILVELILAPKRASKPTQERPLRHIHLPAMAMRAHKTPHTAPVTIMATAKKMQR
jgi:hypothetical protein